MTCCLRSGFPGAGREVRSPVQVIYEERGPRGTCKGVREAGKGRERGSQRKVHLRALAPAEVGFQHQPGSAGELHLRAVLSWATELGP